MQFEDNNPWGSSAASAPDVVQGSWATFTPPSSEAAARSVMKEEVDFDDDGFEDFVEVEVRTAVIRDGGNRGEGVGGKEGESNVDNRLAMGDIDGDNNRKVLEVGGVDNNSPSPSSPSSSSSKKGEGNKGINMMREERNICDEEYKEKDEIEVVEKDDTEVVESLSAESPPHSEHEGMEKDDTEVVESDVDSSGEPAGEFDSECVPMDSNEKLSGEEQSPPGEFDSPEAEGVPVESQEVVNKCEEVEVLDPHVGQLGDRSPINTNPIHIASIDIDIDIDINPKTPKPQNPKTPKPQNPT